MAAIRRCTALVISLMVLVFTLMTTGKPVAAEVAIATFVNGHELRFDVPPVLTYGRLLVPARGYLEAMGARLIWDGTRSRVTALLADREVVMTIGEPHGYVNGLPVRLDVAPILLAGRTLIPLRFLSEALSAQVVYQAAERRIDVTYQRPAAAVSRSETAGARARAEDPEAAAVRRVLISDGPLNVRGGPGTDHPVLATLPTGAVLRLLAGSPDWARVQMDDGREAWVARAYISLLDTVAEAPELADRLVALGTGLVGAPYAWGGETPAGFDCSGFLKYIFAQVGLVLPRETGAQALAGAPVSGDLRPGDILTFTTYAPGPTHTGLYIGSGSFVHAANEEAGVIVTSLNAAYWSARYLGARRVLSDRQVLRLVE